ncbi:MAG TPA: DUF3889 domain-containing protein [Paenibacillus sp.]|nr:DUF3889 domain-containing protein [Paenibacillus sp.]
MRTILLKWTLYLLAVGLVVPACNAQSNAQPNVRAEASDAPRAVRSEPVEQYGKWGKLGLEATQKKYPNAKIVDYEHMGRSEVETFHYELQEGGRKWVVEVRMMFDPGTEEVLSVDFVPVQPGKGQGQSQPK